MKKATLEARSMILTVSIGGLVLLYAFFVFLPTGRAIATMRADLEQQRQFILATQQDFTEIGEIQEDLEKTEDWVRGWKQNSPTRNNLGGFFGRVAQISRTSGTHVKRITPEDPEEMKSLTRHSIRLVVGGRFDQLFAFVQALEQLPFTVWIDRLKLQSPGKASEKPTCELSVTVFSDNQDISD